MGPDRRHIGSYEIISLLGRGGMGEVFRARDPQLRRDVAIKLLPLSVSSDPERLRRFRLEARAAAALNHPNIVTIHEGGESGGERYIVMEVVEGETLHERLKRERLSITTVLDIACQLAEGLAHAHEAGIVHRDFKPRNIIIKPDGLAKILDFGLGKIVQRLPAREDDVTTDDASGSMAHAIVGTVNYMAPEQVLGQPIEQRCDQFAFGAVLYEMLTGTQAFRRDSDVLTMSAIVHEEPRPLGDVVPGTPAAIIAVVEQCLKKRREDRFGSTRDLAQTLRALRDRSRSHGSLGLAPARSRDRAIVAVAAAIVVAVAGTGIWTLTRSALPAPAGENRPRQVVVLPFINVGGDQASQAFSDGIVELMTTSLTQLEQFQQAIRVVPASDIRRAGISSAEEARKAFNATLVVSGSVLRTSDRVRVTMNLIDAATLRQLKARVINSIAADVLAMQDAVVNDTTSMLELELQPAARAVLNAGKSQVPSSSDYYLQGRGYLQRFERLENVENAIALFRRALTDDDRFALAHAALGEAYWRKYDLTKDTALVADARRECARAVEIDDRLAQVRVTLGLIYRGTGEYESAVREFTRALSIDPVNADAHRELGRAYESLGQFAEAEATYRKSIQARPGDWSGYSTLGRFFTTRARYDEALSQFQRVIDLTPDNAAAYSNLGGIQFYLGRYDDAARSFERSVAISPTAAAYSNLGTLHFRQDRFGDAAAAFEKALQFNDADYRVWANLAAAYRLTGRNPTQAANAYRKAADLAERDRVVDPRRAEAAADLAEFYARLGDRERARSQITDASALQPDAAVMAKIAGALEVSGDRNEALTWLTRAVAAGYPKVLLTQSKSIDELKKDPRFQAIIGR